MMVFFCEETACHPFVFVSENPYVAFWRNTDWYLQYCSLNVTDIFWLPIAILLSPSTVFVYVCCWPLHCSLYTFIILCIGIYFSINTVFEQISLFHNLWVSFSELFVFHPVQILFLLLYKCICVVPFHTQGRHKSWSLPQEEKVSALDGIWADLKWNSESMT